MRLHAVDRKNSSDFKAVVSLAALKGSKDWTQGLGVTTQIEQKNKKSSIFENLRTAPADEARG